MMRHLLIAVAGLIGLAAPAHAADAPGKVSLRPGEQTIVLIDDGGRVTVAKGGPARMSEYDRAAVFELLRNHPDAVGPIAAIHTEDDGHMPPPPPVERGAVRISFLAVAATGKESESRLLLIENGYDRGFAIVPSSRGAGATSPPTSASSYRSAEVTSTGPIRSIGSS